MLLKNEFGRMGLGCMGLSGNYGSGLSDEDFIALIKGAVDQGIRIFDTADCYDETSDGKATSGANGHNERLLGAGLRAAGIARNKIFIASKCGFIPGAWSLNLTPEHIRTACEQSLKNLQMDYLDIYYLHRLPSTLEQLASALDILAALIQEGKIKSVGLSEANEKTIRFADAHFKKIGMPKALYAIENELSIFSPHALKNGVLDTCRELGLIFMPYSPICRGLLTNAMTEETTFTNGDFREYLPRFQGKNFLENLAMRDKLNFLAKEKECTLSQLALAWVMAQGDFVFPVPGTRSLSRLAENMGALNVHLTEEDLVRIHVISPDGAKGDRYTAEMRSAQNLPEVD